MIRSALNLVSPGGPRGRLSILIFHRVLPQPDSLFPGEPDAARFDQMMSWVKSWFNVMPLDHAVDALKAGTLPSRAAAITFDDGYADNYTIAMPILQKHGLTATFFIATGFLNGGRMWNDTVIESIRATTDSQIDLSAQKLGIHSTGSTAEKRNAISRIIDSIKYLPPDERKARSDSIADTLRIEPPDSLMMTSAQVKELRRNGMQIGAHTVSHPILARLNTVDAHNEIAASKDELEKLLGESISLFAYPNGKHNADYLDEHATLVRKLGFSAAVSTNPGVANQQSDCFQLPRFTPWDQSHLRFGVRLLRNFGRKDIGQHPH